MSLFGDRKKFLEPFDEDRDWQLLTNTSQAPHEPPAVLRLQRRGYRGQALIDATGLKPTKLQDALRKALDDEGWAFQRGVPIHDQGDKP
jgi:hypothetical protein